MGLTTANARQYVEFLDAVHVAVDPLLGAYVPDLKLHVGRPACILKSCRKARIALLLGTGKVATIEVDETYEEAWAARAPSIGNRSAGCIDLNIFLEQNACPACAFLYLKARHRTLTLKALRALGLSLWPLGTLSSEHPRDQLACLRHRAISPRRGISIAQRTDRGGHRRAGAVGRATTPERGNVDCCGRLRAQECLNLP